MIGLTQYQAEALLICLLASLVWASGLLIGARSIERTAPTASREKVWAAALLLAVLPSLAAPMLAAFGVSLREAAPAIDFTLAEPTGNAAPAIAGAPSQARPDSLSPDQIVGAAAIIYVYGVFLAFFLWVAGQAGLRFAVARASAVTDADLLARIEAWADRFDVAMPAIRSSRHVSSVCITGVMRHCVLVPHGIEARVSRDDLVLMCAHELAHLRRSDTKLFTATQLARVLFWFNPVVGHIAANAELAAEKSADALVLGMGVDRRAYAACFVEGLKFAAYRMTTQPALTPSFTPPDRDGRRKRLNSILSPEPEQKFPVRKRILLSTAASAAAAAAFCQAAFAVDPDSAATRRPALKMAPLSGEITQKFGDASIAPDKPQGPIHHGVDIKARRGSKILAPGDGVVVEATDLYNGAAAWGKVVVIDHGHGLITRYAHLDSYAVKKGQRVRAGDVIAAVGATGKTTGPHLHFETLRDGTAVDPASVVLGAAEAPDAATAPTLAANPGSRVAVAQPADPDVVSKPSRVTSVQPLVAVEALSSSFGAFAFPDAAAEPQTIEPAVASDAVNTNAGSTFVEEGGFDFSGAGSALAIAEDMESRLLGSLNGEIEGDYDLTIRTGDETYRFTSREPMSAAQRAEFRRSAAEFRKTVELQRTQSARQKEDWRREMARIRLEASRQAREEASRDFPLSEEALAEMRREIETDRREQLALQRKALEEAREDFVDADGDFDDALADLDDAESDLDDSGLSVEEAAAARRDIMQQRRRLIHDRDANKRAVERAKRQIELQIEQVDRMIRSLDARDAAP